MEKEIWENPYKLEHSDKPKQINHIENIMNWIETHYTEDFKLDNLSKDLYFSTYYLSHIFKKVTGISITRYLASRRIRQACLLLKTTNLSIEQIGQNVGLTNYPYFCQLFKKIVGTTPKNYRINA